MNEAETDDMIGMLLKFANEAGGGVNARRIRQRPLGSHVRRAFKIAVERDLILATGGITSSGYKWLGDWLEQKDGEPDA